MNIVRFETSSFIISGAIPGKLIISDGTIKSLRLEHVWVETYIPYGNYRGAGTDDSLKTWIPMDGSFKQYTYTNGFDITATVPFSQDAYLGQVQTQNAVHYYQSQIQSYLDANMPETSIVDVKGYRAITQETYHFLPSTLPYITIAQGTKFDSVSANLAATVEFTLTSPSTGSNVSYSVSTAELAGKRITVSYIPATSADEALIANYGGFLYNVPAYMLNLKPVLRVEGVIKLTGEATTLGAEQSLTMQFTQPNGNTESRDKKLLAGAYYAIGLDLQGINENVLGKRNYQLNTNVLSQTAGTLGADDLIGEHLFILATTYFYANDKVQKAGARLFNVATARTISEGITSFTVTVDHIFGLPKSAMPSGINMDVAMAGVIVSAKDGNTSKELAYMDMHGLVGSYNEHDIFEKIDGFSSVSAVKALQTAAANGIPIHKVNAANINQMLTTLQVSSEIKTDIQNAVNAEKEVTISQTNVQIDDWNGVGYIVKDTVSGAGAYMITGGLAGSDSTGKATGMEIAELFEGGPLAWIMNLLDPKIRRDIVFAANKYMYEQVDEGSPEASNTDMYDAVGQCSGLVRRAYWAAGICLDSVKPGLGVNCGKSLADEWLHVGKDDGGVKIHYDLADIMKIYGSVRKKPINNPLTGDIVFFDDTTGPGNPRSHEGIVTTAPDSKGTVQFIHATRTQGVHLDNMNILQETNPNSDINSFIGDAEKCGDRCLSGQLSSGYGTIRNIHK